MKAGADFIIICTNTMHKVAPTIQKMISIPIIHIAEATAEELKSKGISKIGLPGTKYTMTQYFYKSKLMEAKSSIASDRITGIELGAFAKKLNNLWRRSSTSGLPFTLGMI